MRPGVRSSALAEEPTDFGLRREPAGCDPAAGKLSAPRAVRVPARGIENWDAQGAEVSTSLGLRRSRRQQRGARPPAGALEVAECEQLVLLDWSAQRPAKLIPTHRRWACR